MAEGPRTRPAVRRAGLWYLLASTYLVARLLSNRILGGAWGLDTELAVEAAAIPLVQVAVVELFRLGRSAGSSTRAGSDGDLGASQA
ncbi:MAG: hypothetical protein LAO05_06785 [Acidobacteriia bacterium]|nr:hypothetical protein [Terriglobia bacterium]